VKVVSLDLHAETSQMFVSDESGQVVAETQVPTRKDALREAVGAVEGQKCVVFEEGPLSVLVKEALEGVAEQVVSCDPAYNALIARDEDHSDERDARHLEKLFRLEAVRPVHVPEEPFQSLRSLLSHRLALQGRATAVKNGIKALARRNGLCARGKRLYRRKEREEVLEDISSAAMRWQMESLGRELDMLSEEISKAEGMIGRLCGALPMSQRLQSVPGVGPIVAATIVAWIVDPARFKSAGALSAYAGLGLGQAVTNWQRVGPARASRRGNRQLKRVLFLAAGAAARTDTALGRRYRYRCRQGWGQIRAKRDVARKLLHTACAIWKKGTQYDEDQVNGPQIDSQS